MNRRILLSLITIAATVIIAAGGTVAYFSDKETSSGNTFSVGSIDLKVGYESSYNGISTTSWDLKDLGTGDKFFDFEDLKPGDWGEGTITLHVYNNNAWACMTITPVKNDDATSTEPEIEAGDAPENPADDFDGELAQNINLLIWADVCNEGGAQPGDNVYQPDCDNLIHQGPAPTTTVTFALADKNTNVFTGTSSEPLLGSNNYYIGIKWEISDNVGNEIQTDTYEADISFYAVQSRNNPDFKCVTVTR